MPELKLMGPRYKYPVSSAELNRRLAAIQEEMKAKGLDCCIAQSQSTIFDSVIRYMIDSVTHPYSSTLLIPAEGEMVLITHGDDNDNAPIPPTLRNVEKLILKPNCQTFASTAGMIGSVLSKELNVRGFKRIGLILIQLISSDTLDFVRENIHGCELVDFSKEFSYIKAVKSPEEWELIDLCISAHDRLMGMVPGLLRPGRMEYEILADLEHASRYIGCDWNGNVAVGATPNGSGVKFNQNFTANRRIEAGDGVTIMLEVSGPGGMYGELARTFCLGEPRQALLNLFEIAKEAQHIVASEAKPGVTGRELNDVFDKYVTERGINKNRRFVGHGQGYDMMEDPTISPYEDMEMRNDMLLAIHPELVHNGQFSICCDNFRITPNGGEILSKTEQKIFVVDI
jgi:Xaa-Pro aminopeptidase